MIPPSTLQELTKDISKSHGEAGNSQIQTSIFMRCLQLLLLDELADEVHLFCNPSLEPISGHALIMFSFPGAVSPQRQLVEQRFTRSLSGCEKCIRSFHKCLHQMRARFILVRKIPVAQVLRFLDIVNKWEFSWSKPEFQKAIGASPQDPVQVKTLMYEALNNSWSLRLDSAFRESVLEALQNGASADLGYYDHLVPSTIFYLVEGNPQELSYANAYIARLKNALVSLDIQVVDEINSYFYRIQNLKYFTPEFSRRFWSMLLSILRVIGQLEIAKLLKPLELEQMSSHTQIRLFPLIRVLFNNLMANLDEPLPVLLQVFHKLLSCYGSHFWDLAEDSSPANIVDFILANPHYQKFLHLAAIDAAAQFNLDHLLNWTKLFIETLSGSQRHACAIKLADFLVQREMAETNNTRIDSSGILLKCFDFPVTSQANASVSLLKMRDVRLATNKHSEYFVKLARTESEDGDSACLVCAALKYDLLVASRNSFVLETKQIPDLTDSILPLWTSLLKVSVPGEHFATKILEAFADASLVVVFKEKKNSQLTKQFNDALKVHNRETEQLCEKISLMLDKLALVDPHNLKVILEKERSLNALWSCMLNPQISQSTLNVVYQVYDAEGRYEAISSLLSQSLRLNLQAVNRSFTDIRKLKVYEPCPKALRILMDVIKSLTDPLSGILTTQNGGFVQCKEAVRELWDCSWQFLVMIYQQTLVWAGMYHLSDLIEFTRDALDTSHLLLDAFRNILDFLAEPELNVSLFDAFMSAFNHVIVWLRLGDISLLNSCVALVFKGLDLAKELNVNVDKNFIITFAKYGAKAKKFNNKLSEQQRQDMLAKASEFDSKLVQYVVEEVAKERSVNRTPSPVVTSKADPEVKGAAYAYQSHAKGPKQLTLSRFGVVSSQPPVAPPPPKPFKSNNLEAIRNELKSNRNPSKPLAAPAPPRPAGFNSKSTAVGRSLNALKHKRVESESSEDDDEDVDVSDLFLESKKKTKIIEVDIKGRPITKIAAAKKINEQRREEERMRLRLNVNLKPLYSTILKWNYNSNSEFPTEDRDAYMAIKDSYSDAKDYVSQIEPLLMLECWQGIQSSRQTGQEIPFELFVGSRTTCDGFFDVYVSIKKTEVAARKIGETDLLVLGYVGDKGLKSPGEISKYLKEKGSQTCLAKVREIKYANADFCDITVRVYPQGSMMGLLTPKSTIVAMKVMQMITVEREYSSLKGLQYYDLCDDIIAAQPAKPATILDSEAQAMCSKLNVNLSQAKAIIGTHRSEGFSLIQGPPGTGKTKTILGIVGHFLSSTSVSKAIPISVTDDPRLVSTLGDKSPVAKVLICAPSNAAVDELVVRLRNGVVNDKGEPIVPKIVRLGRGDAINAAVRDLGLEEQIEQQLQARGTNTPIDPTIRQEHNKCIAERDRIREALRNGDLSDQETAKFEAELREVNKKRSELGKRLDEQRESASIARRTRDIEKRQIQAKILSDAQVICSTLSGSAHDFLTSMSMKFDQVIIDEACQCVELSAIIPLRYGCKKCVMVGDPNQLPPTVLSQKAASFKYEQSLFVRMQKNNPNFVYLLDVQYRMHPQISKFPSAQFYNSKLSDGEGMLQLNTRPWHEDFPMSPYRFFDILSRHQQNERSKSFFNASEARVALELVEKLMQILPTDSFKGRIGIISPYKEQIRTMRDVFQRKFGSTIFNEIDFNTVDGFQGQEKEIIIMSCVRASEKGSVGFLSDIRRMNVALTRARTTLWILGNKASLRRDKVWNKLISDAEARSCVTPAEPGFLRNIKKLQYETYGDSKARHEEVADSSVPAKRVPVDSVSTSSGDASVVEPASRDGNNVKRQKMNKSTGERQGSTDKSDLEKAKSNNSANKQEKQHFKKKKAFVYQATDHDLKTTNLNATTNGNLAGSRPENVHNYSDYKSKHNQQDQLKVSDTNNQSNHTPNRESNDTANFKPPAASNSGVYKPRAKGAPNIFIQRKRGQLPKRP